jgi:hypothetical protein
MIINIIIILMIGNKFNVFAKKKPNVQIEKKILPRDEIIKSIPKNAVEHENLELAKTLVETRWRFFQFPENENETIEISYKTPTQERLYMNQNSEWVTYNLSSDFDRFIIKTYYFYE